MGSWEDALADLADSSRPSVEGAASPPRSVEGEGATQTPLRCKRRRLGVGMKLQQTPVKLKQTPRYVFRSAPGGPRGVPNVFVDPDSGSVTGGSRTKPKGEVPVPLWPQYTYSIGGELQGESRWLHMATNQLWVTRIVDVLATRGDSKRRVAQDAVAKIRRALGGNVSFAVYRGDRGVAAWRRSRRSRRSGGST